MEHTRKIARKVNRQRAQENLAKRRKIEKAAPALLAACKEIDHFFNESIGQVLTSKQALKAYHNSGTSNKVEQAIAEAKGKD